MTKKEKRDKMLEIVLLTLTTQQEVVAEEFGVSRATINNWKKKFIEDGTLDNLSEASYSYEKPTENEILTPKVTNLGNDGEEVVITRKILRTRRKAIAKMRELIKVEDDLDKVTRAFKVISEALNASSVSVPIDSLKRNNSIFDAARVIAENMGEIEAKQRELKQSNK